MFSTVGRAEIPDPFIKSSIFSVLFESFRFVILPEGTWQKWKALILNRAVVFTALLLCVAPRVSPLKYSEWFPKTSSDECFSGVAVSFAEGCCCFQAAGCLPDKKDTNLEVHIQPLSHQVQPNVPRFLAFFPFSFFHTYYLFVFMTLFRAVFPQASL